MLATQDINALDVVRGHQHLNVVQGTGWSLHRKARLGCTDGDVGPIGMAGTGSLNGVGSVVHLYIVHDGRTRA